jgi:hypothetical protein
MPCALRPDLSFRRALYRLFAALFLTAMGSGTPGVSRAEHAFYDQPSF